MNSSLEFIPFYMEEIMEMDKNYDAFDDFAMEFDLENEKNKYIYSSSYRVMKECENIAKSLELSLEDIYFVKLIGLIHNISKFYDNDTSTLKVLFEDNLISKFDVLEEEYDLIKNVIKRINDVNVNEDLSEKEILYLSIVSDAIKLDTLYSYSHSLIPLKESDNISNKVKSKFNKEEVINKSEDEVIHVLSLVFELNYEYSFNKIITSKYINEIYKRINNKKVYKEYFETSKKYVKENK